MPVHATWSFRINIIIRFNECKITYQGADEEPSAIGVALPDSQAFSKFDPVPGSLRIEMSL